MLVVVVAAAVVVVVVVVGVVAVVLVVVTVMIIVAVVVVVAVMEKAVVIVLVVDAVRVTSTYTLSYVHTTRRQSCFIPSITKYPNSHTDVRKMKSCKFETMRT